MQIEIIFDTVCPWCYIGKRRLDAALKSREDIDFSLQWWPFMLNPNMPDDGMDRQTYLDEKFGGRQRAEAVYGMIEETGRDCGIDFQFSRITRTPSSVISHRLIAWCAETYPKSLEILIEHIFQAYFIQGEDIGEIKVLENLAAASGLDPITVATFLAGDEKTHGVMTADCTARRMGIQGVPAFIAENRFVLSGAQDPVVLGRWIDTAAQS